jgi:Ras-related protein Rab-8A
MDRNSTANFDYLVKLLILGDGQVGKTSMLLRFTEDYFPTSHIQTLGIDFKLKIESINNKVYKFQIWDTAGQERFRKLTTAYYKNAKGIILVYDVTRRNSFEMVTFWMSEIQKHALAGVVKVLVGNQIDKEDRQISTEEGSKMAAQMGVEFFETSAKTGEGIENLFRHMAINTRYVEDAKESNTRTSVRVSKAVEQKKCCKKSG